MVVHRSVFGHLKSLEIHDRTSVRISKNIRTHQALAGGPENLNLYQMIVEIHPLRKEIEHGSRQC